MGYLICNKCEGYYELQPGEFPEDFILTCNCGGELKFHNSIDEYYKSNMMDNLDSEDTLFQDSKVSGYSSMGSNFKRNMAKEVFNSDFRENQKHFFKFFKKHENKNIIADAPTGSGKSLIAIQIAINLEKPGTVFIVTPTKDLMKQYERDFGHLEDVMLLAGKNEYKCKDYPGFTAEQCTHSQENSCKHHYTATKDACEYSKKINTFMDYKVVVTNYHMMLALIKIRHALEWGSSLIIWDESHKFQDIIREMTGIEFNHTRACRIIDEDLSNTIYNFFNDIQTSVDDIKTELIPYKEKYNTKEDINKKRWIERLETQMEYRNQYEYLRAEPYEKIISKDERERCIRVIPVDYTTLSKTTFMEAAPQHLMMSGTIHYPQYKENKRLELIKKITGMDMDIIYETPKKYCFDDSKIIKKAPQILSSINYANSRKYKDFKLKYAPLINFLENESRNIMIHFNAKWQCENMVCALKDSRYIFPIYNFHEGENNTKTKQHIKKRFVETGGCIIGSSLHEGIDFPGEELEIVIIGRSAYVPPYEEDKYHPGTESRIPNKIRKTWDGLKKRGVHGIEQEEYRLKTLQQIGRLQRTANDTGMIILCNQWSIHKDILKDFELCYNL